MNWRRPERALLGDTSAVAALHNEVTRPLADAGPALSETLDAFLDSGGAIEACARKLFVHPNTVRYRLRRIADFTGRDPTVPRDAYVLRVATTVGRLAYPVTPVSVPQIGANTPVGPLTPPLVGPGREAPGAGSGRRKAALRSRRTPFLWGSYKNLRQGS